MDYTKQLYKLKTQKLQHIDNITDRHQQERSIYYSRKYNLENEQYQNEQSMVSELTITRSGNIQQDTGNLKASQTICDDQQKHYTIKKQPEEILQCEAVEPDPQLASCSPISQSRVYKTNNMGISQQLKENKNIRIVQQKDVQEYQVTQQIIQKFIYKNSPQIKKKCTQQNQEEDIFIDEVQLVKASRRINPEEVQLFTKPKNTQKFIKYKENKRNLIISADKAGSIQRIAEKQDIAYPESEIKISQVKMIQTQVGREKQLNNVISELEKQKQLLVSSLQNSQSQGADKQQSSDQINQLLIQCQNNTAKQTLLSQSNDSQFGYQKPNVIKVEQLWKKQ